VLLQNLDVGLYLFFVLSGYLIAGPFVRSYVAGTAGPRWRGYARNRILRIVPAFWFVYALVLIVYGTSHDSPGQILSVFFFGQAFVPGKTQGYVGQAWTLGIELSFYLAVPLISALVARLTPATTGAGTRLRIVVIACALAGSGSLALRQWGPHTQGFQSTLLALGFAFVPGVLLAAAELAPRVRRLASGRWVVPGLAVAAAVAFAGTCSVAPHMIGRDPHVTASRGLLAALCAGCVVAAALARQRAGRGAPSGLDNRFLRWVGARSYGVYLVHQAFYGAYAFISHPQRPWPMFFYLLASIPLILGAAAVSFALVERPALERRVPWRRAAGPPRA
jgi:peptidoglycan/LPS O-acetylase OafA/YrhL